jgi:hypothetical protein
MNGKRIVVAMPIFNAGIVSLYNAARVFVTDHVTARWLLETHAEMS